MRLHPLSFAIHCLAGLAISGTSLAEDSLPHHDERAEQLDAVVVTASPLKQSAEELTRPVSVLAGTELDDRRGATLGDTVSSLPGVRSSGFGPGVGRPVIRGMDGARVQTLSGGMSSLDVSTVSADHAVSIEPFLAEQIEVLKGPATLLWQRSDWRRGECGRRADCRVSATRRAALERSIRATWRQCSRSAQRHVQAAGRQRSLRAQRRRRAS